MKPNPLVSEKDLGVHDSELVDKGLVNGQVAVRHAVAFDLGQYLLEGQGQVGASLSKDLFDADRSVVVIDRRERVVAV